MRIVITGNMGYVGPVLVRYLKENECESHLIGFDSAFFGHLITGCNLLPERLLDAQYFGDIRDFPVHILEGVDAVVHLAAVSNDPMGKEFEQVTTDINQEASIRLASHAAQAGVSHFIFASSCSIYGYADGNARKESDTTNPLTAYARSKIGTEQALAEDKYGDMIITSLRFATACGMSERLRLDLVLNDFVTSALTKGEIQVLSDGTPWRPLIDVEDMARAIHWALRRSTEDGGRYLAINIGHKEQNYQVKDLFNAVERAIPGTRVTINKDALPDRRSYRVDFSLFHSLAPRFLPIVSLDESIIRLREGLSRIGLSDRQFCTSHYIRLSTLKQHIAENRLRKDLSWNRKEA